MRSSLLSAVIITYDLFSSHPRSTYPTEYERKLESNKGLFYIISLCYVILRYFSAQDQLDADILPDFCSGFLYVTRPEVGAGLAQVSQQEWGRVGMKDNKPDSNFYFSFKMSKLIH